MKRKTISYLLAGALAAGVATGSYISSLKQRARASEDTQLRTPGFNANIFAYGIMGTALASPIINYERRKNNDRS